MRAGVDLVTRGMEGGDDVQAIAAFEAFGEVELWSQPRGLLILPAASCSRQD